MSKFVIFLDIDGVLCTHRQAYAMGDHGLLGCLDPVGLSFLNRMCATYPMLIIISSSWRIGKDYNHFSRIFKATGHFNLADSLHYDDYATPSMTGVRGLEIEDWLKRNNEIVSDYLILDDDRDMLEYQMDRLINTPSDNGLLLEHYIRIKETIKTHFETGI